MSVRASLAALVPVLLIGCAALRPPEKEPVGPPVIAPSSLRAQAVVEVRRNASMSGRAQVLAKSPSSFRIEVFGPFGQTAALFASDGEAVYVLTEDGLETYGMDGPGAPYSLDPEDIVSFLLGVPRLAEGAGAPDVTAATDGHGRLRTFTRTVEGLPALKVVLDDYRAVDGAHIPFSITIDDGKRTVAIKYREVEVNPGLDQAVFSLRGPGAAGGKQVD